MNFPYKKISKNEKQTVELAKEFSRELKAGDVVLLEGNLGAGKTFFVRAILNSFDETNVNSPTFAIVNEYEVNNLKVYHFDFYRINKEYELYDIGIDDYLSDENAIVFIEWADLFPEAISKATYKVKINLLQSGNREIEITSLI